MFDPGDGWHYGIALDWVGRLVQEVSDQSPGSYMQEHIFAPLGMTSTGYALSRDMEARRVDNHQRGEDGMLDAIE